jgi:hypothetical protein
MKNVALSSSGASHVGDHGLQPRFSTSRRRAKSNCVLDRHLVLTGAVLARTSKPSRAQTSITKKRQDCASAQLERSPISAVFLK